MLNRLKAIIWDFDGVINDNVRDGHFFWSDDLKEDWDIHPDHFHEAVFHSEFASHVMPGKRPIHEHFETYTGHLLPADQIQAFMDYWFNKDARVNHDMVSLAKELRDYDLDIHIGTNNEPSRAAFIWHDLQMKDHFTELFTSGHIGYIKPAQEYYAHIEEVLGLSGEDLLMIDDMKINVDAAKERGWHGHHFMGIEGLKAFLGM